MGRAAKLAMFERGAHALAVLFPQNAGLYACPLCLLGFTVDEIEDGGQLTEEHAPPDKLGGRVVCLTCAECNHRAGQLLDSDMIRAERRLDFVAGRNTPSLRARIGLNGAEQRGRLSMKDRTLRFVGVPRANAPGADEALQSVFDDLAALGDAGSGTPITVTFDEGFDERHVAIGWLRSAYLVAFAAFGYRYILQPCFEVIRMQIYNPENVFFDPPIAVDHSAVGRRLIFVANQPSERVGVHVGLGIRVVVLPDLFDDRGYVDRAAAMRASRQRSVQVRGSEVAWPKTTQHLLDCS